MPAAAEIINFYWALCIKSDSLISVKEVCKFATILLHR